MATYFDHFHFALVRLMPDFRRLEVDRRRADPRAVTSIVIAGMTLGLALMLTLPEPVRRSAPPKSGEQVAPPPAADKVTIVAGPERPDVPCAEQTWPYIDRRCLTETTQKRPDARVREAAPAGPPIDTRNAAAPVVPAAVPPASTVNATQGVAPRESAIIPDAPIPDARDIAQRGMTNDRFDQNEATELDEDAESFPPPMPPPEQFRRERRRYADPTRHIARQLREIFLPRF